MRSGELFLKDILRLAAEIELLIAGLSRELFVDVDVVHSAVLLKLIFIGEAANHVSKDRQARYPEVDWGRIIGFRNVAIHHYFGIDWSLVWNAATVDTPLLVTRVKTMLQQEFPDDAP